MELAFRIILQLKMNIFIYLKADFEYGLIPTVKK